MRLGLLLVFAWPLAAAYSSLIATSDGSAVFLEVPTSFRNTRWYQVRLDEAGRPVALDAGLALADLSQDAATSARTTFGERYCGFAGSTCWTAPPCGASFVIDGPAGRLERYQRKTLARLSRDGRQAWIEQSTECRGLGTPVSAELQGLYEVPSLRRLAPPGGLTLASKRAGRRLITNRGQVLAQAADTQLHLVDPAGARPIRHQYAATEAVLDAEGRNIVYTDGSPGRMLWIDLAGQTEEDIGFGAAPALSDDGRLLAFLTPEGALFLYRRETREFSQLVPVALDFALAANGRYVFVVTGENRLQRIEIESGHAETWLEPFPEVSYASSGFATDPGACPLICYYPPEPILPLNQNGYLVLGGRFWQDGWRVRLGDLEIPLQVPFSEAAWFQLPAEAPAGRQPLVIFHPDHPIPFSATAQVAAPPLY